MGVEDGNAQSFMASYNAVNKIPDTLSPFIRDIVEKEWKFDGMVSTDAGSLPNLTHQFHFYSDPTSAVAGCVKVGISVFLDPYSAPLQDAFEKKLVTEAEIECNIRGNLRMRMRLGEFDLPEMSPWEKISGTEEPWYGESNKVLARTVTQESIVLLKNSDGLLPMDKSKLRSIAVIGPFGDNVLVDWYAGMRSGQTSASATHPTTTIANCVLVAISWAQMEPTEGKYEFALVDGLIQDARRNNLKLVFLWFGSCKNGLAQTDDVVTITEEGGEKTLRTRT